jgi:hypothetical protein
MNLQAVAEGINGQESLGGESLSDYRSRSNQPLAQALQITTSQGKAGLIIGRNAILLRQ